jgi:hypothetical protein
VYSGARLSAKGPVRRGNGAEPPAATGIGDDARPMMKLFVILVGLAVAFLIFRFNRRAPWILKNIHVPILVLALGGFIWFIVDSFIL